MGRPCSIKHRSPSQWAARLTVSQRGTAVFKTAALGHYASPPGRTAYRWRPLSLANRIRPEGSHTPATRTGGSDPECRVFEHRLVRILALVREPDRGGNAGRHS